MDQSLILDIENFRIISKIGEGSYGIAYLVEESATKKRYVAKESKVECQSSQEQRKFFNEIIASSKVHNPAVLSLLGFNLTNFAGDHYPIIFTEYMPNGSLDVLLKTNPKIPTSTRYLILLGIAKGMESLHEHGIIHRDLKPANILLDQHFYPHISDFGESVVSDLTISSILMQSYKGTPVYMAPEVFSDEEYTYKADVFSFAIVMYQLLTGILPFAKYKSVFKLQIDMQNGKRPDLTVIKEERIRSFLSECWSNDPKKRPTFKAIVAEIQDDLYVRAMGADSAKVAEYLRLFDGDGESKIKPASISPKAAKVDVSEMKKKADKGDVSAMLSYGLALEHGRFGVSVNKKEAARYFKIAADKGNDRAMFNYSTILMHSKNDDEFRDMKEDAVCYCKMSVDKGNVLAMHNYAMMLSHGSNGLKVDKAAAARYYKMAADLGNVKSMNSYAAMLYNGHGVPQDKKEGIRYFQMGADKGNASAMYNLGCKILENVANGSKEAAARYIKIAAERGIVAAMEKYAKLLEDGIGVAVNRDSAERYLKMANDAKMAKKAK